MKQPINKKIVPRKKEATRKKVVKKAHPKYGTSKLEDKFAREFLDKLGFEYERQYEAKEIGRFYDFAVRQSNGALCLIEVDGDYW